MSAMTALTDKLRSAPQGSRELSDEFLIAMGWKHVAAPHPDDDPYWYAPDGVSYDLGRPSPTESIDDALRFAAEDVREIHFEQWSDGSRWGCALNGEDEVDGADRMLALCLAILSAHAQRTEKT